MLFINWIIDNFDYLDCNILAIIVAVILAALIIMSSEFVINILFKRAAHNKLLLRWLKWLKIGRIIYIKLVALLIIKIIIILILIFRLNVDINLVILLIDLSINLITLIKINLFARNYSSKVLHSKMFDYSNPFKNFKNGTHFA